jgi:hypothetical protein
VLASDGVAPGFELEIDAGAAVTQIATSALDRHANGHDDAIVLVARYRGRA